MNVLPQQQRHAAEGAATGWHLCNDLPRVRLIAVPLYSVVISTQRAGFVNLQSLSISLSISTQRIELIQLVTTLEHIFTQVVIVI